MDSFARRAGALGLALAALFLSFFVFVRPWYRGWGADEVLRHARLPGDTLVARGALRETRAIVIDASAARVWPWVAQIGQDRGGFYSYQLLENLAGCELRNLDHLEPALQRWQPGDKLWMYPPNKAGGLGQAPLALYEPGHALVFFTRRPGTRLVDPPDGTWAFIVEPIDSGHSRFVLRGVGTAAPSLLGVAFERGVFEAMHFVMERKMMEGVKLRAEGRALPRTADSIELASWTLTLLAFLASAALVLAGRQPRRRLLTFVAAGALFAWLTLAAPSLAVGVPLVLVLGVATWWPRVVRLP
jgi:hypothetical protein